MKERYPCTRVRRRAVYVNEHPAGVHPRLHRVRVPHVEERQLLLALVGVVDGAGPAAAGGAAE